MLTGEKTPAYGDPGTFPGAGQNITVFWSTDRMQTWKNRTALDLGRGRVTWNTSVGKVRETPSWPRSWANFSLF
jgi:hypothetical protein